MRIEPSFVGVVVSDTGDAIDEENPDATRTRGAGVGLGVRVVCRLADAFPNGRTRTDGVGSGLDKGVVIRDGGRAGIAGAAGDKGEPVGVARRPRLAGRGIDAAVGVGDIEDSELPDERRRQGGGERPGAAADAGKAGAAGALQGPCFDHDAIVPVRQCGERIVAHAHPPTPLPVRGAVGHPFRVVGEGVDVLGELSQRHGHIDRVRVADDVERRI